MNVVRQIGALTQLLPVISSSQFEKDFLTVCLDCWWIHDTNHEEYNDALLITYLASITKTSAGTFVEEIVVN